MSVIATIGAVAGKVTAATGEVAMCANPVMQQLAVAANPLSTQTLSPEALQSRFLDLKTGKMSPDELLNNQSIVQEIPTRNQCLEGDVHPITGVPFERNNNVFDIYGNQRTGVFPKFESIFDAKLPDNLLQASDSEQFAECNRQLSEAIKKNPDLAKQFSSEQLEQIRNGDTPDGKVWHHHEEMGRMQLVDFDTHALTGHTGGKSIWGGGTVNR